MNFSPAEQESSKVTVPTMAIPVVELVTGKSEIRDHKGKLQPETVVGSRTLGLELVIAVSLVIG